MPVKDYRLSVRILRVQARAKKLSVQSRDELVVDILREKATGKTKQEIFEDLVDVKKLNPVYARSVLESLRW